MTGRSCPSRPRPAARTDRGRPAEFAALLRHHPGEYPRRQRRRPRAVPRGGAQGRARRRPRADGDGHPHPDHRGGGTPRRPEAAHPDARALAAHPRILFLDEATSALDNVTQAIVAATMDCSTPPASPSPIASRRSAARPDRCPQARLLRRMRQLRGTDEARGRIRRTGAAAAAGGLTCARLSTSSPTWTTTTSSGWRVRARCAGSARARP